MSKIKRIVCFVIALVMILGVVPSSLIAEAASKQVYYNIDFSDAVLKSRILSVNSTDCALVSVCTVESYLYGATSTADKNTVYKGVINKNLGTTSGVPRDNAVQSWSALGYETTTYSLQGMYDQLEQGYPVLVHRYKSDNAQHWSVVCGYTGSTTTLEKSGFIVVDIESGTGKSTLSQWHKSGYTLKHIGVRKNGVAIQGLSGIRFAINNPPVIHPKGETHGNYGWITSNVDLTKVQVTVTNLSTNKNVYDSTIPLGGVKTDAKLYDIDANLTFAKWDAGKYYFVVRAWDSAGRATRKAFYFEIASSYPSSQPAPKYTMNYDGGVINMNLPSTTATWGKVFTLATIENAQPVSFFDKVMMDLCTFENWVVLRSDGKWYTTSAIEWKTAGEISANNYPKYTYKDKTSGTFGGAWITDSTAICSYKFIASWRLGDTVFTSDTTGVSANNWFKANDQWYYIKDGGNNSSSLPETLALGSEAATAKRINVFVDNGASVSITLPTNSYGKVYSVSSNGSLKEVACTADSKSVTVNVTETCQLIVLKAAEPKPEEPVKEDVVRLYGSDRYATSLKAADALKEELGVSKFNCVVIASGVDFADALSGSYLANQRNAPILLVRNNKSTMNNVKEYIKNNVAPGSTVYLLGGTNAVPAAMESGLDGYIIRRLSGATRYDTNLAVLYECGVGAGSDIIVCTGKDFADGLSASAVNKPVLLVKDSLTTYQKSYLSLAKGGKIYVIGGTNAVKTKIENELANYGTVTRISGNTRYETSVNIAKTFFGNTDCAVIAYGQNFPDGLSGGTLACSLNAPIILTSDAKRSIASDYTVSKGIKSGYVLGGTGLISDTSVKQIFSANSIVVK